MRNLRNVQHLVLSDSAALHPTACAWDTTNNSIICAFGPTKKDTQIQVKRWHAPSKEAATTSRVDLITSWDAPCPLPTLECDKVLSLHWLPDTSTACLVLAGGDIVIVRENPGPGESKIEIVGSVDVGISAVAWSPDEELLAICTNGDTLLYMTREFENVTSVDLVPEDLQASKHVSVGWGKAETQFKGKGAKALRDPTMPEKVDEGLPSQHEDRSTTISWRGDGAYVAVNSVQASNRRVVRIYSREGVLDGVTEPVDYLEAALNWRPAGNLIAGIQRLEDRIDVIFFERNGLRHGQFSLRLSKEEMNDWGVQISLKWNFDSSVLAVCFRDRIQLWTMGNYHYYLKQEVLLSSCEKGQHAFLEWHPEQSLLYTTGSFEGCLERLEYVFKVHRGSTLRPSDYGIVGVIDGDKLLLTPLRLANIPPPMALYEVKVEGNIVDVAFRNIEHSKVLVAVLTKRTVFLYEWTTQAKSFQKPKTVAQFGLDGHSDETHEYEYGKEWRSQQIYFTGSKTFLLLSSNGVASGIHMFDFTRNQIGLKQSAEHSDLLIQQVVLDMAEERATPYFCLNGQYITQVEVLQYLENGDNDVKKQFHVSLPSLGNIENAEIVTLIDDTTHKSLVAASHNPYSKIIVSMSRNGGLFANERCLARDCTSVLTTAAHIIFTTSKHLLKFIHLVDVEELEVPLDTPEIDERCRVIERGARLVTVIPSTSALVLQMPRGNLETIYPRALVLAGIRISIAHRRYKAAFMSCRSHRVDMNIIHDYDPKSFIDNVPLFIEQVLKTEHIDLFLSQLRDEDVSQTMYKETLGKAGNKNKPTTSTFPETVETTIHARHKVNLICDAFLLALSSDKPTRLQNIITSHVCKVPPDLESGLREVAKLQDDPKQAAQAVEHICFLVDVNRLYDTALGLYDLKLTLLVAQQSQKDPREYLPFLQRLQELPLLRRKYEIDNYLGRQIKCLQHLWELNAFEEFKSYTAKHNLYKEALGLCKYQEDKMNEILRLYADHLFVHSQFKDAALAYEYLKDFETASEAYRKAYLWQEALSCANLVPFQEHQIKSLASDIAESLVELKDYYAAATIKLEYLQDVESAAQIFCKGHFYAEAIRILTVRGRADAIERIVDAGLGDGVATMTELLAECKGQLNAQVPRLRELRIKKVEEPLAFYDADVNGGADIPDNVSLAATDASTVGASLFTRYTNQTGTVGTSATRKTSKNKRREERKRARGKKGSVYEEEYLINSIGRLIDRVNAVNDEVARLVAGLMRRRMRERARAVEAAMVAVVELCNNCLAEVFQEPSRQGMESQKASNSEKEGGKPTGADGVLLDSAEELQARREPPVVKVFARLSLLA